MPSQREYPADVERHEAYTPERNPPLTEIEALMRAGIHDPERSVESGLPLREVLADALDELSPKERHVVELVAIATMSLRNTAKQLGLSKTQVSRIRDKAMQKLRDKLLAHPEVRQRMGLDG